MFSNCVDYCVVEAFHIFRLLSPPLVDNNEAFHIFQIVWITAFIMFSNCVDYIAWLRLFTFFDCFHLPSLKIMRLFTFFDCLPTRAWMCGLLRGWGFSHFWLLTDKNDSGGNVWVKRCSSLVAKSLECHFRRKQLPWYTRKVPWMDSTCHFRRKQNCLDVVRSDIKHIWSQFYRDKLYASIIRVLWLVRLTSLGRL
jgi:hypothetical protein